MSWSPSLTSPSPFSPAPSVSPEPCACPSSPRPPGRAWSKASRRRPAHLRPDGPREGRYGFPRRRRVGLRPAETAPVTATHSGLGGSANASDTLCVAQAQHGSAPGIAGQGVANPTSLILSAATPLDWRGRRDGDDRLQRAAALITGAVSTVLDNPATRTRTRDIGGALGTADFAAEIRRTIEHTGGTA
ncbi:isocitrate/isopropylmalate family dehydrogenase [Streptomyces sp. DH-12]|uniref:isocitrate/isopropylmalate family dehydrogenase n=1 Tax=Streptomyces sp. DH-12 TaxID=2072509 RepID=UPI00237C3FB9|nr:isocitrate/isopropylmalate family dehydrogenase [Streptomyces sp. DH-12]